MAETKKPELTPEERFSELVAVRAKEKEIEGRLQEAREQAEQIIAQARERAAQMRAHAEQNFQKELERLRAESQSVTEAEVKKIIAEGHVLAQQVTEKTKKRQTELIEKLKRELLAQL